MTDYLSSFAGNRVFPAAEIWTRAPFYCLRCRPRWNGNSSWRIGG